jgi:bacterioferritin-associated ferredoxin
MYVCVCNEVTDRQIREAVQQGVRRLRDLQSELGVATQCGKCGPTARCVLQVTLAELAAEPCLQAA